MKKTPTIIVLFLLIAVSWSPLLGSADNISQTIYVDDDNISGPWDGTEEHPFLFVQNGINVAEPGDTVFVYDGFYNEHVSIDKTLNLRGESIDDTIIDGTGLGRLCTIGEVDNVVVSGFTFQNAEPDCEALYLSYSSSSVIEHNRFTQNNDNSIYIGGSNNIISENEFINNTYESNTIWLASSGNTLENNTIKNNKGIGISIVAKNNIITGNLIEENEGRGILIFDYPSIKNIVISDNIIRGNNIGIFVGIKSSAHLITNNVISTNKKSGIFYTGFGGSNISYNIFEDNPIGLFQMDSDLNKVTYNTFSSNAVGIQNIQTISNSYTENNFIKNIVHVSFFNYVPIYLQPDEYKLDTWDNNYWDNWKINLPKPIFGLQAIILYVGIIPYCLFDKNPADEPFEV